jgi:hypothetical protein
MRNVTKTGRKKKSKAMKLESRNVGCQGNIEKKDF